MPTPDVCPVCFMLLGEDAPCECKNSASNSFPLAHLSMRCPNHPTLCFADLKSAELHLKQCDTPRSPTKPKTQQRPLHPYSRPTHESALKRRLNQLRGPENPRRLPSALPPVGSAPMPPPPNKNGIDFSDIFAGINLSEQLKNLSAQGVTCYGCYAIFPNVPALQEHIPFCRPMQ